MKKLITLILVIIILPFNLFSNDTTITRDDSNIVTSNLFEWFSNKRTLTPSTKLSVGYMSTDFPEINTNYLNFGIELGTSINDAKVYGDSNKFNWLLFVKDTVIFDNEKLNKLNETLNEYTFYGINVSGAIYKQDSLFGKIPFDTENPTPAVNMINFGFSDIEGMEYILNKNMSIRLLTGTNMQWTYFTDKKNNDADYEIMDIYNLWNTVRFGKRYQSEINMKLFSFLSVYANVDRSVIFPRFIFWEYAGSSIIESIGSALVNSFTKKIKYSSPYIYPVMMFVLNTAYNYGWTELLKQDMNWPFNNDYPTLIYDKFKIGLQIDF